MAARIGALLKLGIAAALLAASGGKYGLLLAQQQDGPLPSATKAAADSGFQACVSAAAALHDAAWTAECKRLADQTEQDRANCLSKLNLPKAYCDASYAARDASANCMLPDQIASVLDAALEQARYRCVREREAARP